MWNYFSGSAPANDGADNADTNNAQSKAEQNNAANTRALTAAEIRERRAHKLVASTPQPAQSSTTSSSSVVSTPDAMRTSSPSLPIVNTTSSLPFTSSASPSPPSLSSSPSISLSSAPSTLPSPAPSKPPQLVHSASSSLAAKLYNNLPPNLVFPPPHSDSRLVLSSLWSSEAVSDILAVSLKKGVRGRIFLAESARDHVNSDRPTMMQLDQLDSIMMERLQLRSEHDVTKIAYLIKAYRRAADIAAVIAQTAQALRQYSASHSNYEQERYPFTPDEFAEASRTVTLISQRIVAFVGTTISESDALSSDDANNAATHRNEIDEFVRLLCANTAISRGLPSGLLESLFEQFADDAENTFAHVVAALMKAKYPLSIDESTGTLRGLSLLLKCPPLSRLIFERPDFDPARYRLGSAFEYQSAFAVHLTHGVQPNDPAFADLLHQTREYAHNETSRLRAVYASYYSTLTDFFRAAIHVDADSRDRVIKLLAAIAKVNEPRSKTHYEPLIVCDDAFMINMAVVVLALTKPITSVNGKFDRVNAEYVLGDARDRLSFDGVTRMFGATADITAARNRRDTSPPSFKFATEIFFIAHALLHQLIPQVVQRLTDIHNNLARVHRAHDAQSEAALVAQQMALTTHLFDVAFINELAAFYDWTHAWTRHHLTQLSADVVLNPTTPPAAATSAAAPSFVLPAVCLLPEYMIDDALSYLTLLRNFTTPQSSPNLNEIAAINIAHTVELCITSGAGQFALKNPHLRGRYAEFLCGALCADAFPGSGAWSSLLSVSPYIESSLVPMLLSLYVDIEHGHRMYYDKFNIRHFIALTVQSLWYNVHTHYKQQLIDMSVHNRPSFLKFINILCNDLIFLMDESLRCLKEIREFENAMADSASWLQQAESFRNDRTTEFHRTEQNATAFLQLANATVHMLRYMTVDIIEPFVCAEMVERMANMVALYVNKLSPENYSQFKVNSPSKYKFAPKELLFEIFAIFIALSRNESFCEKIAGDERSYDAKIFARAVRVAHKTGVLDTAAYNTVVMRMEQIAQLNDELAAMNADSDDIPEEFVDPISAQLMTDPVTLPRSRQTVDRSTIRRQLMNDAIDPFNRTPLNEAELIEETTLKARIQAFLADKRIRLKKQREDAAAEMDVSSVGGGGGGGVGSGGGGGGGGGVSSMRESE